MHVVLGFGVERQKAHAPDEGTWAWRRGLELVQKFTQAGNGSGHGRQSDVAG